MTTTAIIAALACGYAVWRVLRWAIRADAAARQNAELDWVMRFEAEEGARLLEQDRARHVLHLLPKMRGR